MIRHLILVLAGLLAVLPQHLCLCAHDHHPADHQQSDDEAPGDDCPCHCRAKVRQSTPPVPSPRPADQPLEPSLNTPTTLVVLTTDEPPTAAAIVVRSLPPPVPVYLSTARIRN